MYIPKQIPSLRRLNAICDRCSSRGAVSPTDANRLNTIARDYFQRHLDPPPPHITRQAAAETIEFCKMYPQQFTPANVVKRWWGVVIAENRRIGK